MGTKEKMSECRPFILNPKKGNRDYIYAVIPLHIEITELVKKTVRDKIARGVKQISGERIYYQLLKKYEGKPEKRLLDAIFGEKTDEKEFPMSKAGVKFIVDNEVISNTINKLVLTSHQLLQTSNYSGKEAMPEQITESTNIPLKRIETILKITKEDITHGSKKCRHQTPDFNGV